MNPKYETGQVICCAYNKQDLHGTILLIRKPEELRFENTESYEYFINPTPGAQENYEWYWIEGQPYPIAGHWIPQEDIKEVLS